MPQPLSPRDIHEHLAALLADRNAEALRSLLHALADDCHPTERAGFLARLRDHLDSPSAPSGVVGEDLDAAIRDLTAAIDNVIDDSYDAPLFEDDEDALGPFGPLMVAVDDILRRIAARLESGEAEAARRHYEQVWVLLEREDDFGRRPSLEEHDPDQAREHVGRYLRAVYLSVAPAERATALREAAEAVRFSGFPDRPETMYVTLGEIAAVEPRPLPDWEGALDRLIDELAGDYTWLGDLWLREAVSTRRATAGLAALARKDGTGRPNAWLDWARSALREGDDASVLEACRCADEVFPPNALIRASLADVASPAIARADPGIRVSLRQAALLADPGRRRLLDLWEACPAPEMRDERLRDVALTMATAEPAPPPSPDYRMAGGTLAVARYSAPVDRSTAAFAYLLAGERDPAFELARDAEPLGWSSGSTAQPVVFAYVLVALQGGDPADVGPATAGLWRAACRIDSFFAYPADGEGLVARCADDAGERLDRAVTQACARHPLGDSEAEAWLRWCLTIAAKRCEAIVTNKFRKAYPRAAGVVTACCEAAAALGDAAPGQRLVDDVRARFSRHSAFQRELQAALTASRATGQREL